VIYRMDEDEKWERTLRDAVFDLSKEIKIEQITQLKFLINPPNYSNLTTATGLLWFLRESGKVTKESGIGEMINILKKLDDGSRLIEICYKYFPSSAPPKTIPSPTNTPLSPLLRENPSSPLLRENPSSPLLRENMVLPSSPYLAKGTTKEIKYLDDLNINLFGDLGHLLNQSSPNNWTRYAGNLGYTSGDLLGIKSGQDFMNFWKAGSKGTVKKLVEVSKQLDRADVLRKLEEYYPNITEIP